MSSVRQIKTKPQAIKTERLEIRFLTSRDHKAWAKVLSSLLPQKNKWDQPPCKPEILTRKQYMHLIGTQRMKRKNEQTYIYGIFLKKTGELIGSLVIGHIIRSRTQSANLGYHLYNLYWGQGYAEEAVRASIKLAFTDLKLHRLVAGIEKDNRRSVRLIKKFKFRKEGTAKSIVYLRGGWVDLDQYALTCEECGLNWKSRRLPK